MEKILLAVDGSEKAEKAAKKAAELAIALESKVTILTVVDEVNIQYSLEAAQSQLMEKLIEERKNETKKEGEKIFKKTTTLLKQKGIKENKITRVFKRGNPAEYICKEARKNGYDLIILADKGTGRVKRFLLGSTSDRVVRYAEISVMIVK